MRSAAGCISGVCEGALTASANARLAPAELAAAMARSTAGRCPAMTNCPGQFRFAGHTFSAPEDDASQMPATVSSARPRMAAIRPMPAGTASLMARPRNATRPKASAKPRLFAATSAEYSPSEWPARCAASGPCSLRQTRSTAVEAASSAGCVYSVAFSLSPASSRISAAMS